MAAISLRIDDHPEGGDAQGTEPAEFFDRPELERDADEALWRRECALHVRDFARERRGTEHGMSTPPPPIHGRSRSSEAGRERYAGAYLAAMMPDS